MKALTDEEARLLREMLDPGLPDEGIYEDDQEAALLDGLVARGVAVFVRDENGDRLGYWRATPDRARLALACYAAARTAFSPT